MYRTANEALSAVRLHINAALGKSAPSTAGRASTGSSFMTDADAGDASLFVAPMRVLTIA